VIPFKDDNPTDRFPVVTVSLIVVNVLIYFFQVSLGSGGERFLFRMGAIPYEITNMVDLPPYALLPLPLTLISAMFLHGGFMHLGGNMLYLWIFGDNVEDDMGRLRFFLFYILCGIGASLLHILVDPDSTIPMIGASGAIAGILGAYVLLYPRARVSTLIFFFFFIQVIRLPALYVLGFWFFLQILSGLPSLGGMSTGGVAWFAHIGGFIAGMVLLKVFLRPRPARSIWYFK